MSDDWDDGPGMNDEDPWSDEPEGPSEGRDRRAIRNGMVIAATLIASGMAASVGFSLVSPRSSTQSGDPGGPVAGPVSHPPVPSMTPRSPTPTPSLWTSAPTAEPIPLSPEPSEGPLVPADSRPYPVESVTDGDTIRVTIDGESERVRIIGLDSPESRRPGTPIECMALEATRAAKRLLAQGAVAYLEPDPTQDTRDAFGRLLAHVFLADGRLFSEEMIRQGFAIHYVYDGVPSIYADRLAAAQEEAEAAARGLWDPTRCSGDAHAPSAAP